MEQQPSYPRRRIDNANLWIGLVASILGIATFILAYGFNCENGRCAWGGANSITPTVPMNHKPTASPRPTSKPTTGSAAKPEECNEALPTRLEVGVNAYVLESPPTPNRMRTNADLDAKYITSIQPGESFEIIGGPRCGDGMTWWQVRLNNDKVGWTGEGDTYYWIGPLD